MTFCQNHPNYWDSLNQGAKIGTLGRQNKRNSRGHTYSTHHEVLFLDLGVEPEPNLLVVLKWLWFCLFSCVTPKLNKQNQVVKVQPHGLVLVLLLETEPQDRIAEAR